MPQFSNIHALLDNEELHPPRDFSLATNDTSLGKDPMGQLAWMEEYWQRPVKAMIDSSELPVAPSHGDRYVLASIASTAMDSTAVSSTAIELVDLPDDIAVNDIVQYFDTDNDGNAVDEWVAISPKQGYRLHSLANNSMYYFDGSVWAQDVTGGNSGSAIAQEYLTRQQLLDKKALDQLESGVRYYLTDRDMILTATTGSDVTYEGDHTRALNASTFIDLSAIWAGGAVTSLLVNGLELMPYAVSFNGDLNNSIVDLVDTVNNEGTGAGYQLLDTMNRLTLVAPAGSYINGQQFSITIDGVSHNSEAFNSGSDVGEHWFKVKYDVATDELLEMSDDKGNVVRKDSGHDVPFGIDPFGAFPWGKANVTNNRVLNGVLLGYTATGVVSNNVVDYSLLRVDGYSGQGTEGNQLSGLSMLQAVLSDGIIVDNVMSQYCSVLLSGSSTHMSNNKFNIGSLLAQANGISSFLKNEVVNTELVMNGYGQSDVVIGNRFVSCGTFDLSSGQGSIRYNSFIEGDLKATAADIVLRQIELKGSKLDVSGSTAGSLIVGAVINNSSDVQLTNSKLVFRNNSIDNSILAATGADLGFFDNNISGYTELNLTNATITHFDYNQIVNTNWDLTNATTTIERNKVGYSTVSMPNFSGDYLRNNTLESSTVDLSGAETKLDVCLIRESVVEAIGSNTEFSVFDIVRNSSLYANRYTGTRFIFCRLSDTAVLTIDDLSNEIGRINVGELTELTLNTTVTSAYMLNICLPEKSLVIDSSQTFLTVNNSYSNLSCSSVLSTDTLDLTTPDKHYVGIVEVTTTGTLNEILGAEHQLEKFIIKPEYSVVLSLSDSTARNIRLPSSISSISLNGATSDYIEVRVNGVNLDVINVFQF